VAGFGVLQALPDPPAHSWSGFVVAPGDRFDLDRVLAWCEALRRDRPHACITLVAADHGSPATRLALESLAVERFDPSQAAGGFGSAALLDAIRERCVEGRIVREWRDRFGIRDGEDGLELVRLLAAVGVAGGQVATATRHASASESQLRRRAGAAGLAPPGMLLREARVRGVEIRRELGIDGNDAVKPAGWLTVNDFRKVRRRLPK